MRIAFLGFGLIGGSIARALRERRRAGDGIEIVAWSPSGRGAASAERDGTIDAAAATPIGALDGADLIVLAGPPPVVIEQLDALAGPWGSALAADAVITDVASTKSAIVGHASEAGLRFVGGHPMAGRETTWLRRRRAGAVRGPAMGRRARHGRRRRDRPWSSPSHEARALAHADGCGRPRRGRGCDLPRPPRPGRGARRGRGRAARERTPGWSAAAALAATGWRDMTRLARGDVEMGSGIVSTNAGPIAERLRDVVAALEAWLDELDRDGGPDLDVVEARLRGARERLEATAR